MTIEKGRGWGTPGVAVPDDAFVVSDDAAAREIVEAAMASGSDLPTIGLAGGDLCRTLGGQGDERRLRDEGGVGFTIDVVRVEADGRPLVFVAHLVARTAFWGRAFAAMNAQWLGRWNLGPRAHPNDGLVDTYEARLSPADRLRVRSRVHHGAHLPHPGINVRRAATLTVDLGDARRLVLDGSGAGRARHLVLDVVPDALSVVV